MNGRELDSISGTITCAKEAYKHKETLSLYDSKGEENTSRKFEKKENSRDGYVRMYECGNLFFVQQMNVHA